MDASNDKCKLIFSGCCNLNDDELAEQYNLDLLTDKELASVGLERKSLIDDYRHLHELSQMWEVERQREIARELERQKACEASKELMNKELLCSDGDGNDKLADGRKYGFKLLNQLIKKNFEMEHFSIYMEEHFNIYTEYHKDDSMKLLPPKEREKHRFWSHCDYLENLYNNGGSSRAMDIVVIALIRFSKSNQPEHKVSNGKIRSRIPRPTNTTSGRPR